MAGSPKGWHKAYCRETLDFALELVHPEGLLKFFGGEPTLYPAEILAAVRYVKKRGFQGKFRLYSNGVRAKQLIALLEAIPEMDAVLNYSILNGRGAPPIPSGAMKKLLEFPGNRIASGHPDLVDINAPVPLSEKDSDEIGNFGGSCANCFPSLRSDGRFHGCPFAVEKLDPHFDLGRVGQTSPRAALKNFEAFYRWQSEVLEPRARELGVHPCRACDRHLSEIDEPILSDFSECARD